jgi:hypothetical protein
MGAKLLALMARLASAWLQTIDEDVPDKWRPVLRWPGK